MSDAVEVWQIPLRVSEDTLSRYLGCLSPQERARADRFRFRDDRRRFAVARGVLRHLLGRQFDRPPSAIEFCYGEYGKPFMGQLPALRSASVAQADCAFQFNMSHSGEVALCALGHGRKVGVDIEKLKPMERLEGMMSRCLSVQEQARVKAEAIAKQSSTFLWHWTCKEAYLKAIGLGLTQSMQTVEVEMEPPRFVCVPQDCEEGWQLYPVAVPDEYVGALVVAGKAQVQKREWQHE